MHKTALRAAQALTMPIFMAPTVESLRERAQEIVDQRQGIVDTADEAGRDMTIEELGKVEALTDQIETLERSIKARASLAPADAGTHRRTVSDAVAGTTETTRRSVAATAKRHDPRNGFESFGAFARAVRHGSIAGQTPDSRLLNSTTTFGNEGVGADGGFAVPPEFSQEIWVKVMGPDNLLTRCDNLVTGGNSITYPKDETTPWDTSSGVQVYWEGEGIAPTNSKPALEMATTRLSKLTALVPISEELLEDAPGIESWLRSKAPAKMAAKINTALVRGTGVGQPLGILKSPSLISVAKDSGQVAATISFQNISNMWMRMYDPCRANAVWLINQDIESQLDQMVFSPAAIVPIPVYLPINGAAGARYATLKGRPVVPIQACSSLGTQGDIMLVDFTQYMALTKGQDIRTDVSMHLYFDQALLAFRFIFRVNGQPWWGKTITQENGSNTLSWAITLDTRS